jgi:hypothetical protein
LVADRAKALDRASDEGRRPRMQGTSDRWQTGGGKASMDYLIYKLAWYLAVAFVIGLFVGWTSYGSAKD